MKRLYLLLATVLLALNAEAQIITIDKPDSLPLILSDRLARYVDTTAVLSLAEVRDKEFVTIGRNHFPMPYSDATFWFRLTLQNNVPGQERYYVEWDNPTVEIAECFLVDSTGNGSVQVPRSLKKTGASSPYFAIDLPPGQRQTVYLRIRSQHGYRMTVTLLDDASLLAEKMWLTSWYSFNSGMVFLRLFFVLLLAVFAVKDRPFRAYCFLLVLRSLSFWGLLGGMGLKLTDQPGWSTLIDYLSYHFIPIGYVVVVNALLPPDRLPRLVRVVLNGIVAVVMALGVIILFDYRWYWLLTSQYVVLFSQFFILGLYLYAVARGIAINWYYSVPFLLGLGSYCLMVLGDVDIIDAEWVFGAAYYLFLGEIYVFVLFLGKIILDYRRDRENARQQAALQQAQATQLKELDKLKTNFFANISHEFRTPLTMLVGPLEDFRQQQPANPLIPAMQRNVRRLKALIDQLLDLSRLEAGYLRPAIVRADLAAFLQQLFASFESLAQSRDIIFNHQLSTEHHEGRFDPDKLEKIVTNLLSNAFKFTHGGGRVTVRADFTATGLTLQIQDYGIGIEATRLPHIFDRFYRVESAGQNNAEGAGIGLALTHELVKALKGGIQVESTPGRGSTFTLQLPTDAHTWPDYAEADAPDLALSPPETALKGSALVATHNEPENKAEPDDTPLLLFVEDNPDLRQYMRTIFRDQYRIVEGHDGLDGLDRAFAEIPDLVVCDVMMPRLDGFGFCEKLKTDPRTSHIPVVMLTAKATRDDRLAGLQLGADDYLTKPFDRAELELRVQNLLRQRDLLRQKYGQQLATVNAPEKKAALIEDPFLQKAVALVHERLADSSFGVEEFCQAMQVSRSQLHRKLKALTGQSTTEFIRTLRLRRAAELLSQPNVTVSEAAYAVGFESLSYFSKSFQELMGVPPSEWVVGV